jgi:hypothetical protein
MVNNSMLQRAAALNDGKSPGVKKTKNDDSDDDWSDNDTESQSSSSAAATKPPALLSAGARHPSGVIVKQTVGVGECSFHDGVVG